MNDGPMFVTYLVGPTAVGKTSVVQYIAAERGCEILSADSMLVYKDMDIGTAKPSIDERQGVVYHGVDLVTPSEQCNLWMWHKDAIESIRSASGKGTHSIVVGGTGLYVTSLMDGLDQKSGADEELRERLEKLNVEDIAEELKKKDPDAYAALADKQNPRRLIRAMEEAELQDKDIHTSIKVCGPLVGLRMPKEQLDKRIAVRVDRMYGDGLLEEASSLLDRYGALSKTASQAIGYSEAIACINNECSLSESMERTIVRTRQLAKRQMTWFRNKMNVDWVDIEPGMDTEAVANKVEEKWNNVVDGK